MSMPELKSQDWIKLQFGVMVLKLQLSSLIPNQVNVHLWSSTKCEPVNVSTMWLCRSSDLLGISCELHLRVSPVWLPAVTLSSPFWHSVWSLCVWVDRSLSWMTPTSSGVDEGEQSHSRGTDLSGDGGGQGERGDGSGGGRGGWPGRRELSYIRVIALPGDEGGKRGEGTRWRSLWEKGGGGG